MKRRVLWRLLAVVLLGAVSFQAWDWGMRTLAAQDQAEDGGEESEDTGSKEEEEKKKQEEEKKKQEEAEAYEQELEQQRQDTLNEINSIKSDISTVEAKIKELKSAKSNLQGYIDQLDRQVNSLSAQISGLEKEISAREQEIEVRAGELERAEAEAAEQYELMKKRIRYMYEQGEQSFLALLLEAEDFTDFMNRVEYAMEMSSYDRQMMEQLRAVQEEIERQKKQLEEEKAQQEELLSEVKSQKAAVNRALDAKTQEIAGYQARIDTASGEKSDYKAQLLEQEKLLEQVEYQIAAAAAAKALDGDGDGGSGGFLWPCPSSRRITSSFGPRKAPVPGASTYHKGIDIGAAGGSAILAAASGRVTTAAYSASAGNYVVISHGNGVSTVYMHASALYVSEGQTVTKGQTIAAVGSTGYSSGNHLHFGVIIGGSYVNPLNYVR